MLSQIRHTYVELLMFRTFKTRNRVKRLGESVEQDGPRRQAVPPAIRPGALATPAAAEANLGGGTKRKLTRLWTQKEWKVMESYGKL